jgi:DNA modification methylase
MTRRRARPVRLAWEAGAAPAIRPARLIRQARLPAPDGGPPHGRLIHGDNLAVMSELMKELEGRIDLIYLDPPFHSGRRYVTRVGAHEDSRRPESWQTEAGYDDRWPDRGAYLDMLRPRLELTHRLLAPRGTLYVHLDWRNAAYVRVLLDEIFGSDRLLNEIVWTYHGPSPIRTAFSRKHDTLLAYTKSSRYVFNPDAVRVPYDPSTVKAFASSPKAGFGKVPDLQRGKVPEDWWFFPVVARLHKERTGYPTQKPMALMERIVLASSKPGDLVADFFSGSGTTLVAAARNGRRWIGCDRQALACATAYRRLLLECPQESLDWISDGPSESRSLDRLVGVAIEGTLLTARARGRARFQWLEVDWDYNGKTFTSLSQAVRPWRDTTPLPALKHRVARSGPFQIALRAADPAGKVYTAQLAVSIPRRGEPSVKLVRMTRRDETAAHRGVRRASSPRPTPPAQPGRSRR